MPENLETAAIWVDTANGSDANPGTQQLPLKTIGAAASLAVSNNLAGVGTAVTINPGTYRESITLTGPKNANTPAITFQAAAPGTVVMSGAVQYSSWATYSQNTNIYTTPWLKPLKVCTMDASPPAPFEPSIVLREEMVFVNGTPMTQVLSVSQLLFPGTFFVDDANSLMYVWPPSGTDMAAADVEITTLPNLVNVNGFSSLVFRGLTFQYASGCRSNGAVYVQGSSTNIIFDSDTFAWNVANGLWITHPVTNVTIMNTVANHNGASGYHTLQTNHLLWQNVEGSYNNWRGAQGAYYIWNTGGAHIFSDHNETVAGFKAIYNQTFGIHWDTDVQNLTVDSLNSVHNVSGVLFEASEGPVALSNSHFCSSQHAAAGEGGLVLRNTENVTLTGNTLYNNGNSQLTISGVAGGLSVTNWEPPRKTYSALITSNLTMSGNIFEGVGSPQQIFKSGLGLSSDWLTFESSLVSNNNTWWNPGNSTPFTVTKVKAGTAVDFAGWQSVTGQDHMSTFAQPAVSSSATCSVTADAPDWQLLVDNGVLSTDNTGSAVFNLTGVDIGGFAGTATLAVDGVSAIPGATALLPASLAIPGTAAIQFIAGPQTPAGQYTFTVLANSGNVTRTVALTVNVAAQVSALSPASLAFAAQTVGTASPAQTVTLSNNGNTALGITSVSAPAGFGVTNNCPASLPGNTSCTVNVTFAPAMLQSYSGLLTFTFSSQRPQGISLSGIASGSTTTTLTTSGNPAIYGQPVTFMATVASALAGTMPTGLVTFLDGGTSLGSASLNASGVAAFTGSLTAGSHAITAMYGGDSNFGGSTSAALTQNITQAASTVSAASSQTPVVYGTPMTFTAAVMPAGTTGSVQFLDGITVLGSAAVTNGTAAWSGVMLVPGTHAITAAYSGDGNYLNSNSTAIPVMITPLPTVTSLASSNNPLQADMSSDTATVTLTANVSPASAGGTVQFWDGPTSLSQVVLTNASASATVSLKVGIHNLTAQYSGDGLDLATTGSLSQTIYNTPVGDTVAVAPEDLGNGQALNQDSITFTTVSQFGITSIVSASTSDPSFPGPLQTNYQLGTPATFSTLSSTAASSGSITVCLNYAGVVFSQPSTLTLLHFDATVTPPAWIRSTNQSNTQSTSTICGTTPGLGSFIIVEDTSTTLNLSSSANPSTFGQSIDLTAAVSPAAAGGTVTFSDGPATLGTVAVTNGSATLTTAQLSTGDHTIQAAYNDPQNFFATSSAALTQTVGQGSSTIAVSTAGNPAVFGQTLTLTATVAGSNAGGTAPTGSVTFKDGTATLGMGMLSGGKASFSTTTLAAGSHAITAVYGGDINFTGSTSPPLTQSITQAASTVTVNSSLTAAMYGIPLTLTASVTPAGATGSVQFFDGAAMLGMAPLTSGTAALSGVVLVPAVHSITAVYSGDGNYTGSGSPAIQVGITPIVTAMTLTPSSNPVQADAISNNATVTLTAGVNPASAGGTVQFMDGLTPLGGLVQLTNGIATTTLTLNAGVHSLTAQYSGDPLDMGATGTLIETAYNTPTGTNVAVSPASGDTATFSSVSQLGITTITSLPISDPSYPGQPPANYQSGVPATFFTVATTAVSSGSTTLCLSYAGVTYPSGTLTLLHYDTTLTPPAWVATNPIVTQNSSTICGGTPGLGAFIIGADNSTKLNLSSNTNPSTFGQAITFTAAVSPANAAGSVAFTADGASLGAAAVANGVATLTASQLSAGMHTILATYSDPMNAFGSSTATVIQTVNQTSSTTSIGTSGNPVLFGQPVTFSATVAGSGGSTPSGPVTFKDGPATLGTGTLAAGKASFTTAALATGTHSITALYGGDVNFAGSTSAVLTQTVSKTSSTAAVAATPSAPAYGQAVSFTVTVAAAGLGTGTPTGTVTFKDGSSTLGSAALSSGQAIFTTSILGVGSHSISGVYAGDSNFLGVSSTVLKLTVAKAVAGATATPSQNPSVYRQSLTLTAVVAATPPGNVLPTGSVTFKDGTTTLGTATLSSGTANFTANSLSVGSHAITAVYNGDSNFAKATSPVLSEVINVATSTTTISSSANPSKSGQTTTLTATVLVVLPGGGTPTGSVTFLDGSTTLGTGTLNNGTTSLKTSKLSVGTHSITGVYGGDSHYAGSTSNVFTQTVNK